jgi:HK97 family phage major capsid protein
MAVMTATERSIREERAVVFGGMKTLMEKMHETGSLSVEERLDYDKREERLRDLDRDLARITDFNKLEAAKNEDAETRGVSRDERDSRQNLHERAFKNYLRAGMGGLTNDERRTLLTKRLETRATDDANAIYTDAGASNAGYLVPQGFWHNLQIALKQYGGLLNVARIVETSTGNPMPWPTTDPTNIVGSYVGNQGTQLGFQDYVFGQGMMHAWTITSNVALASLEAINDSAFDVEEFVRERIGESIGRFVASELHSGTGSSALLGIKTALVARGIVAGPSGGLYQATATSTVHVLGDGGTAKAKLANGLVGWEDIQGMIAKVDPAYRASGRCVFVCNDNTLWKIRSITDQYGHPLWQPNVQVGGMDNVHGYKVLIDQNAGDISTTASTAGGLYFGDFQTAMVVRQVNQAGVMRLDERYADYLQVGFLGFVRMDARSNDLRAAVLFESGSS